MAADENDAARDAWDRNASFWDARMGEGNRFIEHLIWPVVERLLALAPGQRALDAACGNGLTSRRMAALGADVVAFDFSREMIERARERTGEHDAKIRYEVLDATDPAALAELGADSFDAALCNMALFDMAEIDPLLSALGRLLKRDGRFVFSITHPCFNHPHAALVGEAEEREGRLETTYSVRVRRYMTPSTEDSVAMRGIPVPHPYFHRSLTALLGSGFRAGFVLDALEERAFEADQPPGSDPLSWGPTFSEIPPVLVARMRPAR